MLGKGGIAVAVVAAFTIGTPALAGAATGPVAPPIPNSQDPGSAPVFIGQPVAAQPLSVQPLWKPKVSFMHGNAGNTGTVAFPGPLGNQVTTGSAETLTLSPFMWGRDGTLTAGSITAGGGGISFCIAAMDPTTLAKEATWCPPGGGQINLAYTVMETKKIVIVPMEFLHHVYVVQRKDKLGGKHAGVTFTTIRDIDLTGVLQSSDELLDVMPDTSGNIWFTTGGVIGNGDTPNPSSTIGYVTPSGQIFTTLLTDQVDENGISVDHRTVYVDTGPPSSVTTDTPGYMYAFTSGATGVQTVWSQTYDAGSGVKPGGFARGSGATPTLMGADYVSITDHADNQENALIYQRKARIRGSRLVCSIPLFQPGQSAVDIAGVSVQDGSTLGVIYANDYNAPPIIRGPSNGTANDMHAMSPGFEEVVIDADGTGCHVAWNDPLRIKVPPIVSQQTGLVYGYTQDDTRAQQGTYVWYFVAVDYRTGNVVWQQQAGAGGNFNDDYVAPSLGPDGTLYQALPLGVVWMRDH